MALQQRLGPTFGVFCRTVLHQGDLLSSLVTLSTIGRKSAVEQLANDVGLLAARPPL